MGYRFGLRRGFGRRFIPVAGPLLLWLATNIPSALAADEGVTVACPDLPEARTAELEARARATLLTSEVAATAAISCSGDGVVIRVEAGDESVTLKVRVGVATLREEVLRALDRALADLRARSRPDVQEAGDSSASSATAEPAEARTEPAKPDSPPVSAVAPAESNGRDVASEAERRRRWQQELTVHLLGESWTKLGAIGGGLGVGMSFDSTWRLGVRAGALYPLGLDEFAVVEGHAIAEATFRARALAGLRFGVGAGPSLLFVSPKSGLSASGATWKSAVRFEAQLSRPFRWGGVELSPWIGLRLFSAERGVRIAQRTRLLLGGVLPAGGLALTFAQ